MGCGCQTPPHPNPIPVNLKQSISPLRAFPNFRSWYGTTSTTMARYEGLLLPSQCPPFQGLLQILIFLGVWCPHPPFSISGDSVTVHHLCKVWPVSDLKPLTVFLPQLTVEKLISKGRVLTMANQVLTVNISEEVRSMSRYAHGSVQKAAVLAPSTVVGKTLDKVPAGLGK